MQKRSIMAKQEGIIKITGSIGGLTFFRIGNQYGVKLRSSIPKEHMKKGKAYTRTRENWSEFSKAAKASKLIRQAFHVKIGENSDKTLHIRLSKLMMQVIKSDPSQRAGMRNIRDGNLAFLLEFDFDMRKALPKAFKFQSRRFIDLRYGFVQIHIPSMIPDMEMWPSAESTHFSYFAGIAELDWPNERQESNFCESPILPLNTAPGPSQILKLKIPPSSMHTLILVQGISCYEKRDEQFYLSKTAPSNLMTITAIFDRKFNSKVFE